MMFIPLFLTASLLNFGSAEELEKMKICYSVDGILFVYGIIFTLLYCRLVVKQKRKLRLPRKKPEEGIYTGLTPHARDTYDTIGTQKEGMV